MLFSEFANLFIFSSFILLYISFLILVANVHSIGENHITLKKNLSLISESYMNETGNYQTVLP